jgi:L-alanine-DL-glutamate epimerase-like enolase superfamily enzyme
MARTRTSPTRIVAFDAQPLDIPLREPFAIATGSVASARNLLVRVTLADGSEGIGEAAPFPPSGGETQETALAAARAMTPLLVGEDATGWRPLAARLLASFEHQSTARAGVEVALLDAVARSWSVPLFRLFGGAQGSVETDITIPIEAPGHMAALARQYVSDGARTLKLKVGMEVRDDLERVLAVVEGAAGCALILDGNQGYSAVQALRLLRELEEAGVVPILFEQPVHRHDLEGLRFVTERAGIPVAADESVHTAADALRIARMGAANVINIKLMKSGLVEALDIAAVCRAAHLGLMVGAMIESRLGIAASAHMVAGLGGFTYVDLDTPMLLSADPFAGGYTQRDMIYTLDPAAWGLGVTLAQ